MGNKSSSCLRSQMMKTEVWLYIYIFVFIQILSLSTSQNFNYVINFGIENMSCNYKSCFISYCVYFVTSVRFLLRIPAIPSQTWYMKHKVHVNGLGLWCEGGHESSQPCHHSNLSCLSSSSAAFDESLPASMHILVQTVHTTLISDLAPSEYTSYKYSCAINQASPN